MVTGGSLSTHEIVATQAGNGYDLFGSIPFPRWNVIATGLVPFVVFLIAGTAELNRPPFDLVEAEQELVGGFNTQNSSIRFRGFFLPPFMGTIPIMAVLVPLPPRHGAPPALRPADGSRLEAADPDRPRVVPASGGHPRRAGQRLEH